MPETIRHDQGILKDTGDLTNKTSSETDKNVLISEILRMKKQLLELQEQNKQDTNSVETLHNRTNGDKQADDSDIGVDSEEVYEDEEDLEICETDLEPELNEEEGMLNYETYTQSVKLYEI
ncbi:unnamed protein product [[Candida] boidinii]|nr:unnamed protein product [[Candida] boidinii]